MILSHKIALDPTFKQRKYFAKASGCARFVWNLALAEWNRRYELGEKPKANEIKIDFNSFKLEAFPWMDDIHRDAHAQPFTNLQKAFIGFFKGTGEHPKFHRKGQKDSFYIANDKLSLSDFKVRLPIIGWVRLTEKLRFKGKIMSATVSRHADRWFISISVDVGEYKKERTGNASVGVDVGITSALTLSTSEHILAPKPLKKALNKLKRFQRKISRQVLGSNNRKKTIKKIAKLHARIQYIRRDF